MRKTTRWFILVLCCLTLVGCVISDKAMDRVLGKQNTSPEGTQEVTHQTTATNSANPQIVKELLDAQVTLNRCIEAERAARESWQSAKTRSARDTTQRNYANAVLATTAAMDRLAAAIVAVEKTK